MMKIVKSDMLILGACTMGGFMFVSFATSGIITGLIAGIPSGALGGCVVCIARHFRRVKPTEQECAIRKTEQADER